MKNALILETNYILECPKITFTLTCIYMLINTSSILVLCSGLSEKCEMTRGLKLHSGVLR